MNSLSNILHLQSEGHPGRQTVVASLTVREAYQGDISRTRHDGERPTTPGGTWRDWQKTLVADCHTKKTGKTYSSVYGRMCWDEPAPTITTQFFGFGNGRFGHPDQNRAISLREGAILQSFPKEYEFVPPGRPICKKAVGRLIGNAVPPRLGEVIGLSIIRHVDRWTKSRRRTSAGAKADA
jgi:DNA (cytosine-5)-methyltransferase 1